MKKISITFLVTSLLFVSAVKAQSLQDGVNDLYAERYKSAKATFEKLLASNPNNIDATYWLGQTLVEMDDIAGAKNLYSKALLSSANAPLVIVGMGQLELMENKTSEARQRFEAAITMTRGKKGDDPVILNAVGRAITNTYNVKEKKGGDINYAVEKLEAAAQRDPKNADIFLNLGNAIRKAKPGEAGGAAFQNYQKATEANPKFAPAYHRMAQLFNSQRNWDLYEKYLNDAINADSRFAPAYYDLYYFKLLRQDFNGAEEYAKKYIQNTDPDPQNDYLRVQTLWAKKDFDGAIAGAKNIIAQSGTKAKANNYKLIVDSYLQKKDTASAKEYIDQYFAKAKPDEVSPNDFKMKADVYSTIPGQEAVVLESYKEGIKADTVLENKIDLLKKGTVFFAGKKDYVSESQLQQLILATKPNLTINDYFAAGLANYRAQQYAKSYDIFKVVSEKFPDQPFGWEWMFNNANVLDSVKKDSIGVPAAEKLLAFAQKDSVKYAKQISSSSYFLATYHLEKGDKAKAIDYLKIMMNASADPAVKQSIQKNIDDLSKPTPAPKQPAKGASPKSSSGSGAKKSSAG
ncbi:tetratricopeptide repeat protein [Terrimonas pollutisoli]|uniref:tetratricopeptide repeat protein n=1 Tax=Terrimonas pollutisoli TaxID=3034147 RepID=UPI0023EDAB62|nr:tetratricopeptide repeat protein [Terrimonas sp. H1YJ31]